MNEMQIGTSGKIYKIQSQQGIMKTGVVKKAIKSLIIYWRLSARHQKRMKAMGLTF